MKVSAEFRGIATIVILSLLLLTSFVSFLRSSQAEKRDVSEILLNQEYKIANIPFHAKDYYRSEDRKTLLQLKQEADKIYSQILAMEKGISSNSTEKQSVLVLTSLGDDQLSHALELYRKRFEDYYTKIDLMWDASIESNSSVDLQAKSRTGSLSGRARALDEEEGSDKIGKALDFLQRRNSSLLLHNRETRFQLEENIRQTRTKSLIFNGLLVVFGVIVLLTQGAFFRNQILVHIRLLRKNLEEFTGEKESSEIPDIQIIENKVFALEDDFNRITEMIEYLGDKDYEVNTEGLNSRLSDSFLRARNTLEQLSKEEFVSKWITEGLAKTTETLNGQQFDTIEEMAYEFVRFVTRHLGALQGGVFLKMNAEEENIVHQVASYAYGKKRFPQRKISANEGLVGQVMLEKQYVYVEDLPQHYTAISSGLGEAPPRSIIIIPVVHGNDDVYGAVEIASYHSLLPHEQEYANAACERFASAIAVYMMNENTRKLLKESMEVNDSLKNKEETLIKKTDEMQEVQDQLNTKLTELSKESNLNKNILSAIGKTMAIIEFDMSGKILTANDMYLSVMGYKQEEIIGKHERILVSSEEVNSMRYKLLWDSLSNGSFISGEYCRMSKKGVDVWMNGTYNPIFGLDGKPYKIIKFAEFTTEQKAKDLTNSERLSHFGHYFPVLDLDLDGVIKAANTIFTDIFGYKRKEFRNTPIVEFLENANEIRVFKRALRDAKAGGMITQQFVFLDSEGRSKICDIQLAPLKKLNGDVDRFTLFIKDSTSEEFVKKELETQTETLSLLRSEMETRNTLIDEMAMVLEVSLDGRVLSGNNVVEKWTGHSIENLIGHPLGDLVTTSYQTAISGLLSEPNEAGVRQRTLEFRTPKKKKLWGDTSASVVIKNEVPIKFIFIIFDVTERIEKEMNLSIELEKQKARNALTRIQSNFSDSGQSLIEEIFNNKEIDFENDNWLDQLPCYAAIVDTGFDIVKMNSALSDISDKVVRIFDLPDYLSDLQKDQIKEAISKAKLMEGQVKLKGVNHTMIMVPLFDDIKHKLLVLFAE
ncbi:PAS domain S-box protein [Flammeovirga yaeyamensis]|uniref:PAS domain S-box protein n=1 Tax=Flammeovirga yaeyamensis TaxID=367791 RepID=A0AAX1N901_9BACT|nr:PAS domain S-box protein [Flammeovirga yaeyamensis]MBB3701467.1 PAS domain S-box-containing protein [Flammeovirga yaeyamensis]NMF38501.1 PAS domain S-box protein [Flammeovirga yaeyamensis]QWG02418.1 PAS domain S-box protein [Flammeovirga yaeyamensis]